MVAWIGIVLGIGGAWLALPPITARSWVWSLVVCLIAVMLGIGVAIRGERRFGGFAIASGVIGFVVAYLATLSSIGKLETVVVWSALFAAMLRYATPLIFASIGGMFSERSGVVNIGLEGMMLMGAFFAVLVDDKADSWIIGLAVGILSGGVAALVYAFFAIHLRADQILGGTAINFLCLGLTGIPLHRHLRARKERPRTASRASRTSTSSFLDGVPFLGPIFSQLNLMIWLALLLVVVSSIVMFKTPIGLRIRACGEHPRAADTVGINVYAVRYSAVVLVGNARGGGRGIPLDRLRQLVRGEHDRGTRLHCARRSDLRQLAPVRRCSGVHAVRLLERSCKPPARVLAVGVGALPGASRTSSR